MIVQITRRRTVLALAVAFGLLAGGFAAYLVMPAPPAVQVSGVAKSKPAVKIESAGKPSFLARVVEQVMSGKRLSEEDAARYAHIFAFQDVADFSKADAEIAKLHDRRLIGHVLYQRYMHPDYKTTYAELSAWLDRYADHAGAQAAFDLAMRKKQGADSAALKSPRLTKGVLAQHDFDIGQAPQPLRELTRYTPRARDIIRAVDGYLAESPTSALRRIGTEEAKKIFTPVQYDSLRTDIASSFFYNGKPDKAYQQASASADRSGEELPVAGWIAGLSAWKMEKYEKAAHYFEKAADAKRASAWMASGASYWASRAHLRAHNPQKVSYWLKRAAEYPHTFYGIIALKALGAEQAEFNWKVPALTDRHIRALASVPAGKRALALVDAERPEMAEAELRQIDPGSDVVLQQAVVALSSNGGMPGLAMRVGSAFKADDGDLYDAALYPDAPWSPEKGFEVDRALVYAFIRQESNFNPQARNRSSGAQGLMQLMPATAKHVARKTGDQMDEDKLRDPTVNIDLGQKYLKSLLGHKSVDKDLFKLAVAYNAGPGKLARWSSALKDSGNDPLLFIESIPAAETRIFVERVLANYWIYRIKFNQTTRSLDAVAEGGWPVYMAQDTSRSRIFAAAAMFFTQ